MAQAAAEAQLQEKERTQQMQRQEADGSVNAVKAIVRELGWITGGRGTLTGALMHAALLETGHQAPGNEKGTDLVLRLKAALLWSEEAARFAADPLQQAIHPPPPSVPE